MDTHCCIPTRQPTGGDDLTPQLGAIAPLVLPLAENGYLPMGKLVRDRIPEIIRQTGQACHSRILSTPEYESALRDKLLEEAQEVIEEGADLVTELADLCEVMDAIAQHYQLDWDTIRAVQAQRRQERGGFRDRRWLDPGAASDHALPES